MEDASVMMLQHGGAEDGCMPTPDDGVSPLFRTFGVLAPFIQQIIPDWTPDTDRDLTEAAVLIARERAEVAMANGTWTPGNPAPQLLLRDTVPDRPTADNFNIRHFMGELRREELDAERITAGAEGEHAYATADLDHGLPFAFYVVFTAEQPFSPSFGPESPTYLERLELGERPVPAWNESVRIDAILDAAVPLATAMITMCNDTVTVPLSRSMGPTRDRTLHHAASSNRMATDRPMARGHQRPVVAPGGPGVPTLVSIPNRGWVSLFANVPNTDLKPYGGDLIRQHWTFALLQGSYPVVTAYTASAAIRAAERKHDGAGTTRKRGLGVAQAADETAEYDGGHKLQTLSHDFGDVRLELTFGITDDAARAGEIDVIAGQLHVSGRMLLNRLFQIAGAEDEFVAAETRRIIAATEAREGLVSETAAGFQMASAEAILAASEANYLRKMAIRRIV